MALIYCGIDEAGYGPLLGPLCVGCSVFRIEDWCEGDEAPCLWKRLRPAVCRAAGDKRRRIAVEDSKKLKLANSSVRLHPLHHLERGVLAFMACLERGEGEEGLRPETDHSFIHAAGVFDAPEPWYAGEPSRFPAALSSAEIGVAANVLRRAMGGPGGGAGGRVSIVGLRARAVSESVFNELCDAAGSKAAVTESVLVRYLEEVWERFSVVEEDSRDGVRVVCDRQGGRTQYTGLLGRALPGAEVTVLEEGPRQSRYEVKSERGAASARRMVVLFRVEAESSHLPVALASMIAKLTREVLMARFNRYWCGRIQELKPTAGYSLDARRWLRDAGGALSADERRALVRRA